KAPFEMVPIVCGQNNWPFPTLAQPCIFPPVLLKGADAFQAFYNVKHSGRKLTFRADHGTVEVKTRFAAKMHELTVSTYGMVVLALFEGLGPADKLSYKDISSATGIIAAELRRTLQSLACAKYKVLTKTPRGKEVNDDDLFEFNSGFQCNLAKIKIQTVASKVESAEERKETESKVDEERNTLCEACIVRVMKDRKVLVAPELVNEVIKQLQKRFKPNVGMVKQAIERLIDREYLERDENDRKKLKYVA
ncbi:cullin 3, partial [Pseudohyphozyma bogoriensis]